MIRIDSGGTLRESEGFGACTRLSEGDTQIIRNENIKKEQELKIFNDFGDEMETKWWAQLKAADGKLVEVSAHGFSGDKTGCNLWVYPWEIVAQFLNPIYIREKQPTKKESE